MKTHLNYFNQFKILVCKNGIPIVVEKTLFLSHYKSPLFGLESGLRRQPIHIPSTTYIGSKVYI